MLRSEHRERLEAWQQASRLSQPGTLPRDHQALAGDDDPAAVLLADGVDAAEARDGIAGIDFIDSLAALDQGAAMGDLAQNPALDRRQPRHFGFCRGERNRCGNCRRRGR